MNERGRWMISKDEILSNPASYLRINLPPTLGAKT